MFEDESYTQLTMATQSWTHFNFFGIFYFFVLIVLEERFMMKVSVPRAPSSPPAHGNLSNPAPGNKTHANLYSSQFFE